MVEHTPPSAALKASTKARSECDSTGEGTPSEYELMVTSLLQIVHLTGYSNEGTEDARQRSLARLLSLQIRTRVSERQQLVIGQSEKRGLNLPRFEQNCRKHQLSEPLWKQASRRKIIGLRSNHADFRFLQQIDDLLQPSQRNEGLIQQTNSVLDEKTQCSPLTKPRQPGVPPRTRASSSQVTDERLHVVRIYEKNHRWHSNRLYSSSMGNNHVTCTASVLAATTKPYNL